MTSLRARLVNLASRCWGQTLFREPGKMPERIAKLRRQTDPAARNGIASPSANTRIAVFLVTITPRWPSIGAPHLLYLHGGAM